MKQEQLGGIVGKARTTVRDILTINRLPQTIRDECRGDRTITRQTLIDIARKKQERGMNPLWIICMARNEIIAYWVESSKTNHNSMTNMFANGEHVWALFVGHLCIEKLLKAFYVKEIDTLAPRIHDLYKLALKCNLEMTEEQKDALQYITLFNIEARYEEYKCEFHKKCTKDFTAKNIKTIEGLRTWLLEKITR